MARAALGTAAMAASRTKDKTYSGARYQRLMPRLGKKKEAYAELLKSLKVPACRNQ
jgi:hypothetical protein